MSAWLQAVIGTVISSLFVALLLGLLTAVRRGLNALNANTAAIVEMRRGLQAIEDAQKDQRSEQRAADAQLSKRIDDLETWRTVVTGSLFRVVGNLTPPGT